MGDMPKQHQGPKTGKVIKDFLEAGGELKDENDLYGQFSSDDDSEEEEEEDTRKRTKSAGEIYTTTGPMNYENRGLPTSGSSEEEEDDEEEDNKKITRSAGDIPKKTGKVARDFLEAGGELRDDNENYGVASSGSSEDEEDEEEDSKKSTRSAENISAKMTIPKGAKQPSEKIIHDFLEAGGEVKEENVDYGSGFSDDESEAETKNKRATSDNLSKQFTKEELAELGLAESDLQMSFNGEHVELKGNASGHRRDRSVTSKTSSRTGKTTSMQNIDMFIQNKHNRAKIIAGILLLLLLIGGGVVVALWQLNILPPKPPETGPLVKSPENFDVMVLMGGTKTMLGNTVYMQTAEVFGSNSCEEFESNSFGRRATRSHEFKSETGSTFLSSLNRIVSCGSYSETGSNNMYCISSSSNSSEWKDLGFVSDTIMSEAAYTHWFDKMVIIGGTLKYQDFQEEKDYEQGVQILDFSKEEIDGETSRANKKKFNNMIKDYGEEVIEGACAITVKGNKNNVKIIITGGMNDKGTVFEKALQFEISYESDEVKYDNENEKYLNPMQEKRTSHGCTKTSLSEKMVLIVGGGVGKDGKALTSVEYLELTDGAVWKSLGNLNQGRSHHPSIGRVLGQLVLLGGKVNNKETTEIEVYNEEGEAWEKKTELTYEGESFKLNQDRYDHKTVMVKKDWCNN